MENIKENIKYLQAKKEELESLKKKIADKRTDFEKTIEEERKKFEKTIEEERKKFEESLEPLKESSNRASEEFNLLASNKVCVSLEDLITELSSLTGINVLNMGIKIKTNVGYWGKNSIRKILELMNSSDQHLCCTGNYKRNNFWKLTLFADKDAYPRGDKQAFCYEMNFKLNLEELQSDGKSLLEHCSTEVGYDDMQGLHYTDLVIDKNIGSLNCNLSLNNIVQDEITEGYVSRWYPADLLTQAIINCVERQNEQKQQNSSSIFKGKVKSRKFKLSSLK